MLNLEREFVYVTYNGQLQNLSADVEDPGKCVLLRILFGLFGTGHVGASRCLVAEEGRTWLEADDGDILETVAEAIKALLPRGTRKFCVCVDELRKLEKEGGDMKNLLEMLGHLTRELYWEPQNIVCTVLVTALTTEVIKTVTESDRRLEHLELPPADEEAAKFICDLNTCHRDFLWKVEAVSAYHMRSLVVSSRHLAAGHTHVDVQALVIETFDRLAVTITDIQAAAVDDFVKDSCQKGEIGAEASADVETVSTSKMAMPPAIIWACLRRRNQDRAKCAVRIFGNSIDLDTTKQLEETGKQYDLLRAGWRLSVVPEKMDIEYGDDFLRKVKFPPIGEVSHSSLFKRNGNTFVTVWAGLDIQEGVYYHPSDPTHSWVDRFFLAVGMENGKKRHCLVLYQDKVNASGFSDAVTSLNKAAAMVQANYKNIKILSEYDFLPILCIVNVIGASVNTRKQNDFEHPFVLIRDNDIESFYTVHFAPAIRFLRERWLKSLEGKEQSDALDLDQQSAASR